MSGSVGGADAVASVVERLRRAPADYFGNADVTLTHVESRERPFSSVSRLRVNGVAAPYDVFVKCWRPRRGTAEEIALLRRRVDRDFQTMRLVHAAFSDRAEFGAVTAIAAFQDELAVVTREVRGDTVSAMLEAGARWWPTDDAVARLALVFRRAGEWLRTFQSLSQDRPAFSLDGMREYIDERLLRLVAAPRARFSESDRQAVLEWFDGRRTRVAADELTAVPIHADYSPGNLLFDGTRLTVIDFPMTSMGHSYHDVTHLYTQLAFMRAKPQFRRGVIGRLQQALLAGFDPSLDSERPMFQLMLVQHVVCHYCGLVSRSAGPVARVYNRYQMARHHRWLRGLRRAS